MSEELLKKVLDKIKPTREDEEKVKLIVNEVIERLNGLDAEIHGSFRKGTWLKGDADVDVFVFFPKNVGKEYISTEAIKILRERLSGFNITTAYAEHPYLIVNHKGIEIDIVPALKIEEGEKPITAVDRTPFHTEFINSHLSEEQKDEVRLLKRFMKGIGVYGAEIKVRGFSGYVTELLIVKFGSFLEVLKNASKWKPPVKIFIVKPERDFKCPLILPDPVDPSRNAGAAVSLKRLAEFSIASRYFLKNPSEKFFFPPEPAGDKIKGDVLVTKIEILDNNVVEDLLWGQINKSVEKIFNILRNYGYRVIDVQAYGDIKNLLFALQLESKEIGNYKLNQGPPFYMDLDDFISKNDNIWVGEDGRLYSIKERRNDKIEDIVKSAISLKYNYKVVEQYWLDREPKEPCLKAFLRKTPTWLK
ncbi:CCA tRNA nucleotidyltransferase [Acidianus ambivalens]|uniref:CCA-adding enzyme n=1 Tax=Acidianus ambivalens TaxID=2283 RepID=A0A650CT01_ACIAM|nr:CCA tRNA nucleotidyltransferase [Acidianus ambivalens]MQL55228.1 CCA tRNA nucleotidyltransferase [Acidianus ambivalens]QGR20772.1 CCA tRNA nucleotidyltransferase [Acidianus ambivalens]